MNIEGKIQRCQNWAIWNQLSKGPKNQVTSHLHGATAGQTLAASRRLLLKQFPVLPELKWKTDDAQVVGNQQNGGRTHMYTVLDGTPEKKGLNQTINDK